jgi:hypothetical protein
LKLAPEIYLFERIRRFAALCRFALEFFAGGGCCVGRRGVGCA